MNTQETFLAYAADFEKTYVDDDWSRLEKYFDPDAVYRVESKAMGCELRGPAAIFAGIRKSLDGFDRKFAEREISVREAPVLDGDELRVAWTVTYRNPDLEPLALHGRSVARARDGRIHLLVDSYTPEMDAEVAQWAGKSGLKIDPRYV